MIVHDFNLRCGRIVEEFLSTPPTQTESWQSQLIDDKPEMMPREILNYSFTLGLPGDDRELAYQTAAQDRAKHPPGLLAHLVP
ncbi:MAG: hypothetical protein LC650_01715 [Actinobacteria bacterium]|nr:hypothetical protein [Actinomycetota bacterium]